jgi:WD40 repeat protein
VAFAPDGTTLAAGDSGGNVYLWSTKTQKTLATLNAGGPHFGVSWMAFAPHGATLAAGVGNGDGGSDDPGLGKTYLWSVSALTRLPG